jgi:hypothetical protein
MAIEAATRALSDFPVVAILTRASRLIAAFARSRASLAFAYGKPAFIMDYMARVRLSTAVPLIEASGLVYFIWFPLISIIRFWSVPVQFGKLLAMM